MKIAFLFPGQGAQKVGMGKDVYEKYEEARKIYDKATQISGIDVKKICFEGSEEELNKTENTQIAILTTSLAMLEVLKQNGIVAEISTGLSLGEYGALIYSGILSFEEGIKLIKQRGYCMGSKELVPQKNYSMAAVIGLESGKIENVCREISDSSKKFIVPSNYNCKEQTVISGEADAINEAQEKLKQIGAKRVVKLKTSGPFHTSELKQVASKYSETLEQASFNEIGEIKVIKNIDGTFYNEKDDMKEILEKHITNPVRFDKAIQLMKDENVDLYVEIGPGKTLTSFVEKDNKKAKTYNINDVKSLETFLLEYKQIIKGGRDDNEC